MSKRTKRFRMRLTKWWARQRVLPVALGVYFALWLFTLAI